MKIAVLGIDLGKNVCSVVGLDSSGAVVLRRRVRRDTLIDLVAKLPSCIVGMEACCGAHHLGRLFAAQGHDVRLMSPEYVRPYVKAQKNDDRDAEGIAEAATRPTMRFVEMKTQDQLDMQTLHRSRERLVGERTALINQLRAVLLDRGIVVPQGKRKLEQYLVIVMHPADLRCFPTAAKRQKPSRLRPILRASRKPPNLTGRIVRPNRHCLAHGKQPSVCHLESRHRRFGNLEGSVRSRGRTCREDGSAVRPHRSRIERSRGRFGTMGIVAMAR